MILENRLIDYLDSNLKDYTYDFKTDTLKVDNFNLINLDKYKIELLNKIKHISGDLILSDSSLLEISFFTNLLSVNSIVIENNALLESISGFNSLSNIKSLKIAKNTKLFKIDGFNTLFKKNGSIEQLKITRNKKLRDVAFLRNLKSVEKSFYLHNNRLKTLNGLQNLQSVGYSLSLSFNSLENLNELKNLKRINGILNLRNNKLINLMGLENLVQVKNTVWNKEKKSISLENNNIKDISALLNVKDKTGVLVLDLDEKLTDIKRPDKDSSFYQNEIIELDSKYNQLHKNYTSKKRSIGIISTRNMKRFKAQSRKFYDEVIEIVPNKLIYTYEKDSNKINIDYDGLSLNNLSLLFVFSINRKDDEENVNYLMKLLESLGCSICACRPKMLGKLDRSIYEAPLGYEATNYIITSYKASKKVFRDFSVDKFPLISKPINGAGGRGIEKIDNLEILFSYIKDYYERKSKPLIFEHFYNLLKEWRVYIIDGEVIATYEKVRTTDTYKFNISQGSVAKKTEDDDLIRIKGYIKERLISPYDKGFYGLDVALKEDDNLFLIEYNMQPGIAFVKETSGIDIVYEMFRVLSKRD